MPLLLLSASLVLLPLLLHPLVILPLVNLLLLLFLLLSFVLLLLPPVASRASSVSQKMKTQYVQEEVLLVR